MGVQLPGVYWTSELYNGGAYRFWLYDTAVTSWASADYVPDHADFQVYQSGPRRLWDKVHGAWHWWDDHGRPDFTRFGLTVNGEVHTVWLDDASQVVGSM